MPIRLLLVLLLAASLPAADPPGDPAGTLVLELSGDFPLRGGGGFLPGDEGLTLHEATLRLQRAFAAPEARLVLDLTGGFAPGLAAAEELAAILRARPAGKTVACLLDRVEDSALVVAAACDEAVVVEAGLLLVDGIEVSTDYYAAALAKLGVKVNAVTSGPAKSAPEPFTRDAPTEAARRETEELAQRLDRILLALSLRPGLSEESLRAARARAPQTSRLAVQAGLVSAAVEPGAWLKGQPAPVRWLGDGRERPDLNSLGGLMTMWSSLLAGDTGGPKQPTVVAVVELAGMIVEGSAGSPGVTIAGAQTADLLDDLADDARVVAVVLRVDSGGGDAGASDRIHHAVRRLSARKPVVALFDGVAASGGYYLACAANEIQVHRSTITGSIGVFALVPDLTATRDLLGITRHTVTTGPRADLWSTGVLTADKAAAVRQVIEDVDRRFQALVGMTRRLGPEQVLALAGGRVFTGEQAVELGLADGIGTLASAVARARALAGQAEPLPLERHPKGGGLAALFGLQTALGVSLPAGLAQAVRGMGVGRPLVWAWAPWGGPIRP